MKLDELGIHSANLCATGHTALLLKGGSNYGLFVFGGRDSGLVDTVGDFLESSVDEEHYKIANRSKMGVKNKILSAISKAYFVHLESAFQMLFLSQRL